ncbi:MAG: DUF2797 domain-containing protein [Bacteroidales bacterium]|nr:DUF2797 domain-containing protein [Bacteroidales bacterium]
MRTELKDSVNYFLSGSNEKIFMNGLIGKEFEIVWQEKIECVACGNSTKKSFAQGHCYPCFISVPETAPCILRPELCEAHKGIARDIEWSQKNCLTDHYVYLALTSGLKVGVTRSSQIPARWMDQGAIKAIKLAKTPNRYTAGMIETQLKKYISDRTSWQKMLKNEVDREINLIEKKTEIYELIDPGYRQYIDTDNTITEINYPVIKYPEKVKSINLDKSIRFKGKLTGIKGQYLIFEDGSVINIRKYGGYIVEISW